MLSVRDLKKLLAEDLPERQETELPLEKAAGYVLAREVIADHDVPPFPRAMMDGFAVRAVDTPGSLRILEEIPAGTIPTHAVGSGRCSRIMTGAPVPEGADAVVQHEKTRFTADLVEIPEPVLPGTNIVPPGSEIRRHERVLPPGTLLTAPAIATAAMFGAVHLAVWRKPTVAVLATGNELVPPSEPPGPAQIRNSNGFSISAQVREAGFEVENLGIARDDPDELRARIRFALDRHDVLILSGGVSAGAYDLVIECLNAEGVESVAHQVAIKPGKPLFYGRRDRRRVFGLPGNPLSACVTFEVFVRPFLGGLCGLALERPRGRARLLRPIRTKTDRERYIPASIRGDRVDPIFPKSSADILCMTRANGFVVIPPGLSPTEGEEVEVMRVHPEGGAR